MSNIIEEFFLLFKSDATDLKRGLNDAQQRLDEFAKKAGKAPDPVAEGFKKAQVEVKNYEKQVKDAEEANRKLSNAFSDLTVAGLQAIGLFAGFEGFKKGLEDAFDYNLALDKSAKLTGENAHQLAVWDSVFEKFTDNKGEFTDWFQQYASVVQRAGGDTKQIIPNLLEFAQSLRDLPLDQARQRFQQYKDVFHLPDDFFLPLREGKIDLENIAKAQEPLITVSEKSTQAARDFEKAWQKSGDTIRGVFTDMLTPIEEVFTAILNFLNTPIKIPDWLIPFIPSYFLRPITAPIAPSTAFQTNAAPQTSGNAPLGIRSNNPGNVQPGGVEARFGSLQEGVNAEDRNLQNYAGKGVNTLSGIAARWPDRAGAADWLKTVSTSSGYSPNQPLDMNDPQVRAKILNGINRAENGAAYGNLISSAQDQIAAADQNPLNAGGAAGNNSKTTNTVQIQNLTVNTQATDATGIAGAINDKLNEQFRLTVGNYDDGVMR